LAIYRADVLFSRIMSGLSSHPHFPDHVAAQFWSATLPPVLPDGLDREGKVGINDGILFRYHPRIFGEFWERSSSHHLARQRLILIATKAMPVMGQGTGSIFDGALIEE
jgi:hypothetical protein